MKKVYRISITHFKIWYRNRTAMFWVLAFPMLLMILFGGMFSLGDNKLDLYIQNEDLDNEQEPTEISKTLINLLDSTNAFNLKFVDANQNISKTIVDRSMSRILIIPHGFEKNVVNGNATVIFKLDKSQAASQTALGIVRSSIQEMNYQISASPQIISIHDEHISTHELRFIDYFMPGVIGISIMTTGMFGAIGTNTRYRQNKVLRKLTTTPLTKLEWILGMVFYQMILSFISSGIIITLGIIIFNVKIILDIYSLLIIMSGGLVFPGMGMLVARFVKNEESGDAAANAITFPMMFLSGTFFPLEGMPNFLQSFSKLLPLTYVNNGLREAMILGRPDIAFSNLVIILIIGIVFIILGTFVTTWREK